MSKPSTERVRDMYTWAYAWRSEDAEGDTDLSGLRASNRAEFDAWLAEHDRQVKARALEEFADVVHVDSSLSADDRPVGWANRLRARAAQIRAATAPDPISAWNAWESARYDKHPRYDDAGTGVENEQERDDD